MSDPVNVNVTNPVVAPKPPPTKKHVLWTVYVFLGLIGFISGLMVWQFWGLTPQNWCLVAKLGDRTDPKACFDLLVSLIGIKDHIVIGLMATMAIVVVCMAVVVLKIAVKADAPGGVHVDIASDHSEIKKDEDSSSS